MKIAVIGTGYVGLVTAACFAQLGHTVTGVDIDEEKVKMLKSGKSPIYEPGLEELIEEGLREKRLSFTTDLIGTLPHVQVVFSAVATPPGEGHKADLTAVFKVAETVAQYVDHDLVFITKSTVPVGTCKKCEDLINDTLAKRGVSHSVAVVDNPEFLREGMAVGDTLMPERIVVGMNGLTVHAAGGEAWAKELIEELYRPITRVGKPLVFMNRESAEIVKYASNAFLATKISFINMLSELAEKTGGNIREVAIGMGLDSRIGPRFLHAGIGYGGSCFPKDVKALMATAKEYGVPMPLVEATDVVNRYQRERFTKMLLEILPKNARVAVWGLAFKPKTDDMREAPSLDIIPALLKAGHSVAAYDPVAMDRAKPLLPDAVTYADSPLDAAKDTVAIVLLTEWDMFRGLDLKEIRATMKGTHLFDGRNVYEPEEVKTAGLQHHGIGIRA
jgi:UDPglucose 6-dehydrogenase